MISTKQNLYIRKLNGLGQKITVQDSLRVNELKQIVRSLKSLQPVQLNGRDFNLIYKGRNIGQKSQNTLKQLNIPSDGIIHVVFVSQQEGKHNSNIDKHSALISSSELDQNISISINKPQQVRLRVIFNSTEHELSVGLQMSVLQLKKKIAIKLNLVYQSLILSHLGTEMLNQRKLSEYELQNQTLISLKFNVQKPQKKKLQTRMVSSVTLSDENNQPNSSISPVIKHSDFQIKTKFPSNSSKSIASSQKDEAESPGRLTSLMNNKKTNMYKSDINSFSHGNSFSQGASKAAMMFKNALHQKIIETESVVSGSFSEDTTYSGCDPNSVLVTVKNQEETKEFVFECLKTHQVVNIREKLLQVERMQQPQKLEISMEEDLFQSIDLNKSGCVTLNQIVKKMGKERAVFIYRII